MDETGLSDYALGERLHQGPRSVVYRARRHRDGVPCVIKIQQSDRPNAREIERFQRQYDIALALDLDSIVRPYALARHHHRMALVMEDYGAVPLSAYVRGRRVSVAEAAELGAQIARALGEIHERRVVHKDINPSNVVIHPETRELKVIDFGISSTVSRETPWIRSPNLLEGTIRYISPEQTGRTSRVIDHRTDFYSLGVMLYELLTGAPPFQSLDALEVVHAHLALAPAPPHEVDPRVPRALSSVVLKLLAKAPEDRYQSAKGIVADLEALAGGEDIPGFVPGLRDAADRFQIPQRLYGREPEAAVLRAAVARVARGPAELVLVSGYAGIGKSALVSEVHDPLSGARGHFASGKFDQLRRDVPYASLIDALQDLGREILAESEAELAAWRRVLAAALGPNVAVIASVVPAFELVLGKQPLPPVLGASEAQHRFHFAFARLLGALASHEHPLVIFLDDLQWADAPSLSLIQHVLTDGAPPGLCLIGAFRDNEVTPTHALTKAVEAIRAGGTPVTDLHLGPLGPADVTRLVADTLRCDEVRAAPLAALLLQKTEGNPFFIGQLLGSLHEDRLIELDAPAGAWRWDLDAIRARGIVGDVVELVARKIQRLSPDTQQALKLAACLGNRFDLRTLAVVARLSPAALGKSFEEATAEGLILPTGEALPEAGDDPGAPRATFRFLHDRVQQAAYSLIEGSLRSAIHLDLGRLLLASTPAARLDERVVDIVTQLGLGIDRLTARDERHEVARLALRAGRKAKVSAAYEPALRYFTTGLRLLADDAFATEHALAFALHAEAAEAEYLNAHFDEAEQIAGVALAHAETTVEKIKLHETRMLCAASQNRFEATLRLGLEALALVDIHLPFDATPDHFGAALGRNHALLAGRSVEGLVDLPAMTDPALLAAQRIFVHMGAPAYMSNPLLFLLISAEWFALCLRSGNSRSAPVAYVTYGSVHSAALGDALGARAYGDLAVAVMERYDAREARAEVQLLRAALILPWSSPIRDTYPLLDDAFQAGVETGDIQHAAHTGSNLCTSPFVAGDPLEKQLAQTTAIVDFLGRNKHHMLELYNGIVKQAVQNLLGRAPDVLVLTGDAFDEERDLPQLLEAKSFSSIAMFHTIKAMLAYLFGDHARARASAEQALPFRPALAGLAMAAQANLFHSLALLSGAADATEEERVARRAVVEKNQAELARWAEHAPENVAHKHDLVAAELARLDGRAMDAITLYLKAIRGAAAQRFRHEEGIAGERCAELFASLGWGRAADAHLADAYYAYLQWGATAKVAALEAAHPALLAGESTAGRPVTSSDTTMVITTSAGASLEVGSVMKAARAISGEIVLEKLTQTLLRIMVENAGAQRGLLLLDRGGRLTVESEWTTGQAEVAAPRVADGAPELRILDGSSRGASVEDSVDLPAAIVSYAARTGESVVLADAAREGRFTKDPYVAARRPRSVLCAPLFNQGALVAVIYLENNLSEGAFTSDRLEVLRLLSGQAVLSIHNATLFATLEHKVEERTHELREKNDELVRAQRRLVAQEKLASLGVLTAGIAHELRNPLNFINNFAALTVQLAEELAVDVAAARSRMGPDAAAALDETAGLIRENMSKIEDHGKRADQIISSMLQHTGSGEGHLAPTDLQALITRSVTLAAHSAQDRGWATDIEFTLDFPPDLPQVDAVGADLGRVFINVVSNACYAVAEKKKRDPGLAPAIHVSARDLGDAVEVRVRDNGTGVPADIVDKIFTPFFTTKPTGEGTGLGLSISHDIVYRHHGEMSVETEVGVYAEFVITLPRTLPRA